jgi:hypothetical protein
MISHPAALAGIAPSLSIIIAGAWLVHQRTGNSGWVDTILDFRSRTRRGGEFAQVERGSGTKREAMDARGLSDNPVAPARAAYCDTDGRHRIGTACSACLVPPVESFLAFLNRNQGIAAQPRAWSNRELFTLSKGYPTFHLFQPRRVF